MKATGIIRRIDDMGRICIPKEIRRAFKLHEGEPLEIFTSDNGITFVKYDPTPHKEKDAQIWLQNMKSTMDKKGVRFLVEGRTVSCEGIYDNKRVTGTATCNPNDDFSFSIGMVYAYCRAFNVVNPLENY